MSEFVARDYALPVPSYGSKSRELYEFLHNEGRFEGLKTSLQIDTAIDQLRERLMAPLYLKDELEAANDLPEIHSEITAMGDNIRQHVADLAYDPRENWQSAFAPQIRAAYFEPLVTAPYTISKLDHMPTKNYHMRQMRDHLYGVSGELLQVALEEFDAPNYSAEDRAGILGVINELTAASLLNRYPNSERVTLPAPTIADAEEGTDLVFYAYVKRTCYTKNLQIKSSSFGSMRHASRFPDVQVIHMNDTHDINSNLHIARLIVQELDGWPGLSAANTAELDNAMQNIQDVAMQNIN
ncbi:hypothetical protein FJZ39_02590 [Candidatus Saccharibacteria bacterium]|nr:hypothetical protein [Candidatus Saccharibacteria bacterium]